MGPNASPPSPQSAFVQGFLIGQLVLGAGLLFLFRYLYMDTAPASREKERAAMLKRTEALQASLNARAQRSQPGDRVPYGQSLETQLFDVLQKSQYDLSSHAMESLDWLNVMLAQAILAFRTSVLRAAQAAPSPSSDMPLPSLQTPEKAAAKQLLERALNDVTTGRSLNLLDRITVTDIDFGSNYPRFANARVRPAAAADCLRLEVDFAYDDQISLGLDTRLLLNFPQLRFGSLALALCLRVDQLAGTLGAEIGQRPRSMPPEHEVRVCLYPDFVLQAHISSIVGSKNKLQDAPKIEELLLSRIRIAIQERLVWPNYWSAVLPRAHA
ncbi:ERMES complex subunit mmm1 [Malassezia sp. CBS 17886]|nr:ERMES complex subunit mmm1 [Malassezia sp. CBS 17886]